MRGNLLRQCVDGVAEHLHIDLLATFLEPAPDRRVALRLFLLPLRLIGRECGEPLLQRPDQFGETLLLLQQLRTAVARLGVAAFLLRGDLAESGVDRGKSILDRERLPRLLQLFQLGRVQDFEVVPQLVGGTGLGGQLADAGPERRGAVRVDGAEPATSSQPDASLRARA